MSFISKYGLVKYTTHACRKYTSSPPCELGACLNREMESIDLSYKHIDEYRQRETITQTKFGRESLISLYTYSEARKVKEDEIPRLIARDITREERSIKEIERRIKHLNLRPMMRDHCHEHGWIRGFACPACNLALAFQEQFTPSKNTQAFDILWKAESKGFPWNPNNGNVVIDVPEYLKLCPECK